ncbi:MAG: hypothetical protein OEZ39_20310 [Gammaproteobacteria bacterium]|nr:hypothetical protein [Gammaproteobacteria bacterium]
MTNVCRECGAVRAEKNLPDTCTDCGHPANYDAGSGGEDAPPTGEAPATEARPGKTSKTGKK